MRKETHPLHMQTSTAHSFGVPGQLHVLWLEWGFENLRLGTEFYYMYMQLTKEQL
jgi:hypothetical protein